MDESISSAESKRFRKPDWLLLALVLVVALSSRGMTFNRVFERDPEGCGAFYGQLARNYYRQSLIATAAVPIMSLGEHEVRERLVFYPNHPPLLPLLIAGVYGICGWGAGSNTSIPPDWQSRLPSTLFTIAMAVSLFVALRTRASARSATFAAIIFSIVPMTLTFGSQPDVISPQLCFFAFWTCIAYLRFVDEPSIVRLAAMSGLFFLAAATDWPAFHLAVVLGLHFVFTQPWRRWGWIIAFAGICACVFALLYCQAVFVTHDWHWMGRLVARRALSSDADHGDRITLASWFHQAIIRHAIANHTWIFSTLTVGWLVSYALRRSVRLSRSATFVLLMFGWAAVHVIVGRQGVFVHEWWWWPLTPAVAMAGGLVLDDLLQLRFLQRVPSPAATAFVTIMLLAIGLWNGLTVHRALSHPSHMVSNAFDYSLIEMGEAIRAAAPLNECVMLAESDETLGLWFYADRPIKRGIWWDGEFERRRTDGFADLPFHLSQPWPRPPAALIVPKAYGELDQFLKYLRERFPMTESKKFYTFQLNEPITAPR